VIEPLLNRTYVESIQITMAEAFDVSDRGSFYDRTGAIRDVVQNHMLQVVGFLAMEPPATTYPDSIRDEQVKVFRTIRPLSPDDLVRGQYRGYRKEEGVARDSAVETYAAVRLHIDSWRWDGVPFFIRAGKKLATTLTEVMATLRRPPLSKLCPHETNYVRFRLSPEVTIAIGARVKHPGEEMLTEPTELRFVHKPNGEEMDGGVRLDGRVARDTLLLPVTPVLPAHEIVGAERTDRAEYLHLLVANRLVIRRDRRLHREQAHHLQHVILDDVADRAGLFVELASALDAERLGHRDLDVVDVVAIPDRLEKRVREAEDRQVLDGSLAEVVIDAEDVGLVEGRV